MNTFIEIKVIDYCTLQVQPGWSFPLKNGASINGNKIRIRELYNHDDNGIIMRRLEKLLQNVKTTDMQFIAPELVETHSENPMVSCSVYVAGTNITYFFPELVHKY